MDTANGGSVVKHAAVNQWASKTAGKIHWKNWCQQVDETTRGCQLHNDDDCIDADEAMVNVAQRNGTENGLTTQS